MSRLTESNGRGGFYYVECFKRCDGEPKDCGNCVENEKICHKLGLYEETGLEPEEVEKLAAFRTPKAPIRSETQDVRYVVIYICPSCGGQFTGTGVADFCYHCGQALDWDEIFEEESE